MKNKLAVITGATRGIGRAIAIELAKDGYDILINFVKSYDKAQELSNEIKSKFKVNAYVFQADISKTEDIEKLYLYIINNFKNVDVLVNNAGICIDEELSNRTFGQFVKTFETNVFGPYYFTKLIGDYMVENKNGKIINISSNNALNCFNPTTIDYDATKCALNSLTKNFAIAFAPYVNVNAIAPGWIDTDMNKSLSKDFLSCEKQKILKGRIGLPEDVAYLTSFLVSEKANYINGQVIVIDGGMF